MTEHGAGSTEQKEAPERTAPCSVLLFATISVLAFGPSIASTQQPTVSQVQQALQQQAGLGDMVRTRIAQSGLSADQIRARLLANGYPATLLDAYMGTNAVPSAPGSQELEVQQAYANLQTARETIRSQQKTVEQALEAVRLATRVCLLATRSGSAV